MATVNVKQTWVCAGGGHLTLSVTGDIIATIDVEIDDLRILEQRIEDQDRALVLEMLKCHFRGMTRDQVNTELTSLTGVTMVI